MFNVLKDKCISCKKCISECPAGEISLDEDGKAFIRNKNCIACGHCIAVCPKDAITTTTRSENDKLELDEKEYEINSNKLLNFMKFRRSTRSFTEQKVSDEAINTILEAGRYSPTATNAEDVSFVVVREDLANLKDLIINTLKDKGEEILAMENASDDLKFYAKVFTVMYKRYQRDKSIDRLFFNAPAVIFVKSKNVQNGSLASAYMELMANSLGLGCCYIGFATEAIKDSNVLKDYLGVAADETVVSCLIVGYKTAKYLRTPPRKKINAKYL